MEVRLAEIKKTLDQISKEVSLGKIPAPVLKDFKLSVDQLRVTIWAILTFEEQPQKSSGGAGLVLANKLIEFRIKRLIQMLTDFKADLESRSIAPENPELKALCSMMNAVLECVPQLK